MKKMPWRIRGGLAGAAAAMLALSACATDAGSAAVVGDQQLTDTQLGESVADINEVLGRAPKQADAQLTRDVISRWLFSELVDIAAEETQVTVTQTEVDRLLARRAEVSGMPALLMESASQGIAPDRIRQDTETQLLAFAVATDVAVAAGFPQPTGEVLEAALLAEMTRVSGEADARVNPRYGTWLPELLTVLPPGVDSPLEAGGE